MALNAMTTSATKEYVSVRDPAKTRRLVPVDDAFPEGAKKVEYEIGPNATVFTIAPLDVFLMGYIYDNASSLSGKSGGNEIGIVTKGNQTNIDTVRFGLIGIKNLINPRGGEVIMKRVKATMVGRVYDSVPDDVMTMLGVQLCSELADEIKALSEVTGAEEKKSAED